MPAALRAEPTAALDQAEGLETLEALRPEWHELWSRCDATPFQHPAWLLPWAETHAPDRTAALTWRVGGRLEAVLPVFTWEGALYLAGAGPSDYGSALFALGAEDAAPDLLAAAARLAVERGCRAIDLPQLRPGDPLLDAPAPRGWTVETEPGAVCPVAPLLGPEGLDAVPSHWRKKLAYAHRKVARAGAYGVERAGAETLPEIWSALEAAHAARWRERGEDGGVLADDLLLRLLRRAGPALLDAGLLRLYGLRLEGRIAAGLFALHDGPRVHGYLTGFDPALGNLGLGSILIGHGMTEARREGAREMHFLRGQEPYKYTWGAADTPTFRRVLRRS
jgi:CelD/BcsL family acetyltransferase involved in cellulose biosynthesis